MAGGHWDEANAAATSAGVELEPLDSLEDADHVTDVMVATWGNHQEVPRELIRALQGSGNAPWGAFHNGRLVGYVLGWLGRDDDGLHIHSHMLAVLGEWRARGVGYALKLAQRAAALDIDVHVIRWTFDPANAANAYFNLAKLGAEADAFHRSYYGLMDDALNRGERTDRLVARWDLSRIAPGPSPDHGTVVVDRFGPDDACEPTEVRPPAAAPALVRIPPAYRELRSSSPEAAARWREAIAAALESCLDAGLRATGFTSTASYVFT
jgi:predicted GNAT superfamily acetyltransferase